MDAAADLYIDNGHYLSSDDELNSFSPLLDLYIQDYGNNSVVNVMTPFTFIKFEKLWDLVCVDFISAKIVKLAADIITAPLTAVINSSINQGEFPESWKWAKIVPVYKKKKSKFYSSCRRKICHIYSKKEQN